MSSAWEHLAGLWASAGQRLRVRSALNPVLWLCAIATPTCIWGAIEFRDDALIRCVFVAFAVAPILVTCGIAWFFALKHPDKLQSEDYQLRHESLQIIQQKSGRVLLDPTSIHAIANPAAPQSDTEKGAHS